MNFSKYASLSEVSMVFIRDPLDFGQPPHEEYWSAKVNFGPTVADVLNDDIIINGQPGFDHLMVDMFGF